MKQPYIYAVVPAAGIGSRMQADRPKQYLSINGKTILEHTLDTLITHPRVCQVIVAISAEDTYFSNLPVSDADWLTMVTGGNDRAQSVLNGLLSLPADSWVLVHDAARPCLTHGDIDRLLAVMNNKAVDGGILASPVRDTMKRAAAVSATTITVKHTECRENLWHALTPQLFNTGLLRQALEDGLRNKLAITDEASAMEAQGYTVELVEGNPANIKITRPADLPLATFYLTNNTL
ncbi:2-C-methyl-D-erythritol 4-phosphate cytidylyltransferase [Salinimonas chungwhensis]|uniref:2-C-methyl-D-erythritol 4-phosphate cytidylyltransferase n=1 Tax=Salinimonas chungwhensis TaxID=265425 RepID=UPI0003621D0A|nr:2-C-methyl-D-erythritol 4-phosphate cytidylyltransferase [Salinimonas chungwhensis]